MLRRHHPGTTPAIDRPMLLRPPDVDLEAQSIAVTSFDGEKVLRRRTARRRIAVERVCPP